MYSSGIAFNRDEAKITVRGVPDTPGIAYKILGPIGEANVDLLVLQLVTATHHPNRHPLYLHQPLLVATHHQWTRQLEAELSTTPRTPRTPSIGANESTHINCYSTGGQLEFEEGEGEF